MLTGMHWGMSQVLEHRNTFAMLSHAAMLLQLVYVQSCWLPGAPCLI